MNRLRLVAGLLALGLVTIPASAGAAECSLDYPVASDEPRTNVAFDGGEVLRAFRPASSFTATPGATIKVWYGDNHALLLGVRQVRVKTAAGTTSTDYPVTAMTTSPAAATRPQVGATSLDGDQAGTDVASCKGYPDHCDRPLFPALFLTDITEDEDATDGDWQHGGTPIPPHAVFGSWKAAVRTVDKTRSPAVVTVTPDGNPMKNRWNLGAGDPVPAGVPNVDYGAEVRWSVDELVAAGRMVFGHVYRVQFMVHDGDQARGVGQACVNVTLPECGSAADCDDADACTVERCVEGVCGWAETADCTSCDGIADCDDDDACTVERCVAGVCEWRETPGCTSCDTADDCDDGEACTVERCAAGVCEHDPVAGCASCETAADCDDGNACTTELCSDGVCGGITVADCMPCTDADECDDGSPCTTDSCEDGACSHLREQDCVTCSADAGCDDGNACTTDTCDDGVCAHEPDEACVPCTTAADCQDDDACTTESCVAGVCQALQLFDCEHPTEVCGDCIDNDGDGRTDFEDPTCCPQLRTMGPFRGRITPRGTGASAVRLQAELAFPGTSAIDPQTQDVFVQVRAEGGRSDLLCARVPAGRFRSTRRTYRFRDAAQAVPSARGLQDMIVKVGRRGSLQLRANGPRVQLRGAEAGSVRVTIAMYGTGGPENTCWSSTVPFRASRRGKLLTP